MGDRPGTARVGDQRHRPRVADHVAGLGAGVGGVDRPEDRARLDDRPPGFEELDAVGEQDRDGVAGLDAEVSQPSGELVGAGIELAVGDRPLAPADKRKG